MGFRTGVLASLDAVWKLKRLVCRVIGHDWGWKLSGRLCRRCSLFEAR
jgi:hypothetical protein